MRSARPAAAGHLRSRCAAAAAALALVAGSACGRAPRIALPDGAGAPFPNFTPAFREATAECAAVTRLSASIRLSGHAGATKLAARIDAGFAAPERLRLEGYPRISFGGRPFFVLVSNGGEATLLMPRDARVLRGASPSAVVEALAGVPLGPADLRAVVAGCGLQAGPAVGARTLPGGWARVEAGDTSLFLRQIAGRWRVAGARRANLAIGYGDFAGGRPASVHLTAGAAGQRASVDLLMRLSEVEPDAALEPRVFEIDVPREAAPLTMEELRRAGPLGEHAGGAR